jgi:uncharacterized protein YrrD
MRRGRDVIGIPVITRDTGTRVGKVEDVVIDRPARRVLGFLLDEPGWFAKAKVVAWPAILMVGFDALIIDSETSVKRASEVTEMQEVLDRGYVLQGAHVHTTAGLDLGKIENFYFDPSSGNVQGFELSGGHGKQFLPLPASFEAGADVAFVDPSAEATIEDLKAALRSRQA